MAATSSNARSTAAPTFPTAEVESRFRRAVEQVEKDSEGLREPWEPTFDSLAIVDVVLVVEDLVNFPIEPEKVVRKGGYETVDEAVQDMTNRLRSQWMRHNRKEHQ